MKGRQGVHLVLKLVFTYNRINHVSFDARFFLCLTDFHEDCTARHSGYRSSLRDIYFKRSWRRAGIIPQIYASALPADPCAKVEIRDHYPLCYRFVVDDIKPFVIGVYAVGDLRGDRVGQNASASAYVTCHVISCLSLSFRHIQFITDKNLCQVRHGKNLRPAGRRFFIRVNYVCQCWL